MQAGSSKLSQRWRQRRRKSARKEGAGRPTLYPGKVPVRHATGYFTADAWEKLAAIRRCLALQTPGCSQDVSVSDALEMAIHHLHDHLHQADPAKIPA